MRYSANTTVNQGTLLANNSAGSATGSSAVTIMTYTGTLGGTTFAGLAEGATVAGGVNNFKIPRTKAVDGKLFGRLFITKP